MVNGRKSSDVIDLNWNKIQTNPTSLSLFHLSVTMNKDDKLIQFQPKASDVVLSCIKKWAEEHAGNITFQTHLEMYHPKMQTTMLPSKSKVDNMGKDNF